MNVSTNNRLSVLAADIRAAHAAISRTTIEVAERTIAAGHMLIEAKAAMAHGNWSNWLVNHAGLSARTARRYMQIARSGLETATVADLGIRGATERVVRSSLDHATNLDTDPAYIKWRDTIIAGLAAAPSPAARAVALQVMREQVEVEKFAARLSEMMAPDEMEKVTGWLERSDPKQVAKMLRAKLKSELAGV